MVDKYVESMKFDYIIEKGPAHGYHPCVWLRKPKYFCVCVDYRNTMSKFLVRETWPRPDIESHIDTVVGAKFVTVCDVQSAYIKNQEQKWTVTKWYS